MWIPRQFRDDTLSTSIQLLFLVSAPLNHAKIVGQVSTNNDIHLSTYAHITESAMPKIFNGVTFGAQVRTTETTFVQGGKI